MTSPAPHPDAPTRSGEHRATLGLLVAGIALVVLFLVAEIHLAGGPGLPLDDSWIHLQLARHLALGQGLTFQPGEPVTGSTAPLWTAIVSCLFLLPGPILLWVKLLGVALYLAGIDATRRLARALGLSAGLSTLAAALTLATGWLVWSALSGMEITLFVLLTLWGMILHVGERRLPGQPPWSMALFGLAVLARPEGALLLLLAAVDRLVVLRRPQDGGNGEPGPALRLASPAWRPLLLGVLFAACALAGTLLFNLWAGGSLLPTTYAAKGGEGLRRVLPSLRYLHAILPIFLRPQPWMTLFAGAGVLTLVARLGTARDRGLLPALWLLGLPLAYSLMSPLGRGLIAGNFGRYYFPLLPVLVVVGMLGVEIAARSLPRRLIVGPAQLPLAVVLVALLLAPTLSELAAAAPRYARNVADVEASDVRMARFLAERLPPEAVLAVNDIGALGYFLPNRLIDLVGIATPEILPHMAETMGRGASRWEAMVSFLAERRPDYVLVFPEWLPDVGADPRFPAVHRLPVPDNITMGGDELVLYATPWTRYPLHEPGEAPPGR